MSLAHRQFHKVPSNITFRPQEVLDLFKIKFKIYVDCCPLIHNVWDLHHPIFLLPGGMSSGLMTLWSPVSCWAGTGVPIPCAMLVLPLGFTRLIWPTTEEVMVNEGPLAQLNSALLIARLLDLELMSCQCSCTVNYSAGCLRHCWFNSKVKHCVIHQRVFLHPCCGKLDGVLSFLRFL